MTRREAQVDRGAEVGEGLFETILLVRGHSKLIELHAARMQSSAAALGLPCPANLAERMRRGAARAWKRAVMPRRSALRVRLTMRGPRGFVSPDELTPRLSYTATRISPREFREPSKPLRAVTIAGHRIDPRSRLSGHKSLSWMPFVLARREARAAGAHVGLIRTVDGDVAEADFANVFAVLGDRVVTPPLERGVLPGVTRARALAAFATDGRPVAERRLRPSDLQRAREVFLTSSLSGITPLSSIDGTLCKAPGSEAAWLASCLEGTQGPRTVEGSSA